MSIEIKEDPTRDISDGRDLPSMFWAGTGAAAIPMIMGLIGLYLCSVPTVRGYGSSQDFIFAFPISICFAFGTPLVAWLSCRDLTFRAYEADDDLFKIHDVWPSALKYSFYVHGLAALTQIIIFSVFSGSDWFEVFLMLFMISGIINAILYVIITIPISLFCTAIFVLLYRPHK